MFAAHKKGDLAAVHDVGVGDEVAAELLAIEQYFLDVHVFERKTCVGCCCFC